MSPIVPPVFRSPLTTPTLRIQSPTVSQYSLDNGFESDKLALTARAALPTLADLLNRKARPQYYITLTITSLVDTYTTTILLGDNYPVSPTDPVQQSASNPTLTPAGVPSSGVSPGNVAGIVIGVLGSVAVLAGILYVYMLRAMQWKREKTGKKRRRKKKKKQTTWFTFNFKFKKGKKKRRSRRSSTSTGGRSRLDPGLKLKC
jgi:hypothetical protein